MQKTFQPPYQHFLSFYGKKQPQPQNPLQPKKQPFNGNQQDNIPYFKLIQRGNNINEREFNVIIHASNDALNLMEDPLSDGIVKRIIKDIGGAWLVFACADGLKGYDFSCNLAYSANIISFTLRNFKFVVSRLTNSDLDFVNQINELKQQLNNEKNKYQILLNEMQNLQNKNNINNDSGITSVQPGEKIIAINFVSMGTQDIGHYCMVCKNTDMFVRLEEKLYKDYPKFKDYETYFEIKTKRIKRFKTLDENGIKNNDVINIFIIEEN